MLAVISMPCELLSIQINVNERDITAHDGMIFDLHLDQGHQPEVPVSTICFERGDFSFMHWSIESHAMDLEADDAQGE